MFGLVAPATYTAQIVAEFARSESGDPRVLLWTFQTAYYAHVAVAVWWGMVAAVLAAVLAGRRLPEKLPTRLAWTALGLFPLLLLLVWLFP